MGEITGFKKYKRATPKSRNPKERILDYKEIYLPTTEEETVTQGARCMDCGIPFCHSGCPLGNIIPDFNDAVYRGDWKEAYEILSLTNNFPEFTGRICPAPCEGSCVLGINNDPVAIEYIEKSIIERAYSEGWVQPTNPTRSGKQVAVVGSGPAGLAAADQLNKAGHFVTVFEKNDEIGGLVRYGIPDFKLEKWIVKRRVEVMRQSGIEFKTSTWIGKDISAAQLKKDYDAIVMCGGSTIPRDLKIPGRDATGVYFAMDFLEKSNRFVAAGEKGLPGIFVKDKHVVVIGGGDTGSDCVGTSNRHGASSITQIELLSKPKNTRGVEDSWPNWPMVLRTSSSHEEGCDRKWSINTKEFIKGDEGQLVGIKIVDIQWDKDPVSGRYSFIEVSGSERIIPADFVFLALGFLGPDQNGAIPQLGLELDDRGNVKTQNYRTSVDGVFAAGDMRRGQSLVVWAISEGREAAKAVDEFLRGHPSVLDSKEMGLLAV
ncbi:MAG TPA: glutamate synthase subunit beta [Saprospiraceae bacterium]|nr:glutamate synthase subunit beta [Saprospiraceae bacterium]